MTPQETVERALALSKADGCVVIAEETSTANLRWASNTLTTNGVARKRALTVVATVDGAAGTAAGVVSRTGVTADDLEALVRAAEQAARDNSPAEDAGPLAAARDADPRWDEPPAETSVGVFGTLSPALGEAFARSAGEGRLLFGYASHSRVSTYLGTSTGVRLRHDQPDGKVEINAKSADYTRSAWAGVPARDLSDVDVDALEAGLATRLRWAQRRVEMPAGRYETILPPSAVADLMVYLLWSAGARDAHDGRTVFSRPGGGTRVGESLSPVPLAIRSDPGAPGLECAPFVIAHASSGVTSVFDNGMPLAPTAWVREGRLAALLQTRHSAELTGLPVTPPVDNVIVDGPEGGGSLDAMVAGTGRGLLLTCLWYIREVDPQTLLLTGLTRDGVYLVEGGEVVGAVNNFRFNESPVDLLSRLAEVGRTGRTLPREWSDFFTRAAMPPLRIPDFNMSSVSQAS
ncbi:MAG: metallopeptidase TldD-related protein [Streptomycetales bacterium]